MVMVWMRERKKIGNMEMPEVEERESFMYPLYMFV
jgi:hypothetical protein